ncbi:MAG: hypothetical protein A2Z78_01625 [Candidatus Nealsonbacteria bacterium RBG_13_36_15]|uniref:Isoleucine--tRNA ligase n=1 Tax=Candidatus Nealsonbacteria bacterium RBG_13_36_15 TaxID=1801660 RepID=A0A1G2DWZ4_9BACT|nr:MAG: hypothetical protein A2Z78_01625 [Candidatus Nealsonbacteria bacterium RBG_13_36_15]
MKFELELPKIEEKVLQFWKENKIFKKTLEKTKNGPRFVFYEGPPYANGLPGIHHLLSRALKDVILRYKTMQGFFAERKGGWDTHGLPTEVEAEKKLNIKTKGDIEKIGIEKFIEECRNSVFTYKKEWEEFTERIGFWLDLKNAYITCSNDYIESLWWILKRVWEKGFLYQDYKVVPYCPRCGTSLSSHEVAQGYEKIKENSIYIKFKLKDEKNTYLLVWTTTPWTLPGNLAIAINPEFSYLRVRIGEDCLILAKERLMILEGEYQIEEEFKGEKLLNLEYESLFKTEGLNKKAYFVISGDFVSTKEGTGLVHIAPAFGEEDMEVGKQNNLPILMTVDEDGKFKEKTGPWAKMFVKKADPLIIKDLQKRNLLFREETYEHDYPFCWRCDSPLLYYAKTSWFIKMTAVKEDLIKNNKKINWMPEYLKEGRFGEWLKEVKDWNLSRERYWGTPLPIWVCEKCDKKVYIESKKELKGKSDKEIKDLHRPYIDEITFKCDCGGEMRRVTEVIDCWFDSGSMPFAQWHYPFENKERIDKNISFPADYICEGIDQTRGWFYTLLAVSTLLDFGNPYKNVISNGIVLDAKGQKMSKSKGNVILPKEVIDQYGVDAVRFYFYTLNPIAEPKRFNLKDLQALYRKFFDTLNNSQAFFLNYIDEGFQPIKNFKSANLLDNWIFSRLENLKFQTIKKLNSYDIVGAARPLEVFIDDLSNWYIRRSRRRFQRPKNPEEKEETSQTLYCVLLEFSKLLAPFCPFISEKIYQGMKGKKEESVHLADYPKPDNNLINQKLEEQMKRAREIVALSLAERMKARIRVRQPLNKLEVKEEKMESELTDLIKEEVNVKEVIFDKKLKASIRLHTEITLKLKEEGIIREVVHCNNKGRKELNLRPKDKVISIYDSTSDAINKVLEKNKDFIANETSSEIVQIGGEADESFDYKKEIEIDGVKIKIIIKKIG